MKFYLNYVLGSGFPPSPSPGGRESNVPFPAALSRLNRHHHFVSSSLRLLPSACVLPSQHQAPPEKSIINGDNNSGKSADTITNVPEEKVEETRP